MPYYRIKIEERYNGEKLYIPQYCKLEITGTVLKRQRLVWYNILNAANHVILSDTTTAAYSNEAAALEVIEAHKNKDTIEAGRKIKSTTYKMID